MLKKKVANDRIGLLTEVRSPLRGVTRDPAPSPDMGEGLGAMNKRHCGVAQGVLQGTKGRDKAAHSMPMRGTNLRQSRTCKLGASKASRNPWPHGKKTP